jgi:hypothetical protein
MSKGKESQKMFQWMRIGSNELKWAKWGDAESLFNL